MVPRDLEEQLYRASSALTPESDMKHSHYVCVCTSVKHKISSGCLWVGEDASHVCKTDIHKLEQLQSLTPRNNCIYINCTEHIFGIKSKAIELFILIKHQCF